MDQHTTDQERDWPDDARDIVGDAVEIHLNFRGAIPSGANRGGGRVEAKDTMREAFSEQLSELAKHEPRLMSEVMASHDAVFRRQELVPAIPGSQPAGPIPGVEFHGRLFSAIVSAERKLVCHLDITLLRRGAPGGIVHLGDLDNRLKTIFDALRVPRNENEAIAPSFPAPRRIGASIVRPWTLCLLEDDSFITQLTIKSGRLLEGRIHGEPDDFAQLHLVASLKARDGSKDWMGEP